MKYLLVALLLGMSVPAAAGKPVTPDYAPPRVVFDFYFDDPAKIGSALYWVRALTSTYSVAPYDYAPEDMHIVIVIHGTELVTLAKKNAEKYEEAVGRMRYYADLGVKFRVCGQAMADYGYAAADLHDFVEIAPNAIAELAHWQQQGHALIVPQVMDKRLSLEAIR